MAQLTRSNIAYDLTISPHRVIIPYGETQIEFVFSSELYKRKFLEKMKDHRKSIEKSLSKRFGFTICTPFIADVKLYTTIEKRGFLLCKDGVEYECQSAVIYDGETVTFKSFAE